MSSDSPKIKYPYRRYWPTPPIIQSFYQYQDVNADKRLQTDVIEFFYKKVLSWIDSKEKFLKFKNFITSQSTCTIKLLAKAALFAV